MKDSAITAEIISVGKVLTDIIKADLAGNEFSLPADVDFVRLYNLCEIHRVTPLTAKAVLECDFAPQEIKAKFKKELFKTAMRYESQQKERLELTEELTKRGIRHCFLKGHKLSRYYPAPEQRFMLDMDVWVEPDKISSAEEILIDRGYQACSFADDKDIGYIKKPFLNVEIHKELKYDYDKGYEYYKGAFDRLQTVENTCEMNMTNEDFYVYILSHCAHHFETAGTGIRNVLDHYYLNKKLKPLCNEATLEENLKATGLSEFCKRMDSLSDFWFANGTGDESLQEMADYIVLSGVFGNETNHYLSGILRGDYSESKSSFVLSRAFPPVSKLKDRYPVLKKAPFLLPFIWLLRIVSALLGKKAYKDEIKTANSVTDDEKQIFASFIRKNGL